MSDFRENALKMSGGNGIMRHWEYQTIHSHIIQTKTLSNMIASNFLSRSSGIETERWQWNYKETLGILIKLTRGECCAANWYVNTTGDINTYIV